MPGVCEENPVWLDGVGPGSSGMGDQGAGAGLDETGLSLQGLFSIMGRF